MMKMYKIEVVINNNICIRETNTFTIMTGILSFKDLKGQWYFFELKDMQKLKIEKVV